jgi:hypothetical protein
MMRDLRSFGHVETVPQYGEKCKMSGIPNGGTTCGREAGRTGFPNLES